MTFLLGPRTYPGHLRAQPLPCWVSQPGVRMDILLFVSYPNDFSSCNTEKSNTVMEFLAGWLVGFDRGKKVLSPLILWFSFIFQEPMSEIPSPYLFLFLFTTQCQIALLFSFCLFYPEGMHFKSCLSIESDLSSLNYVPIVTVSN